MGWTSFSMRQPVKEWFKGSWDYDDSDYEVLDSAIVQRMTIYGAIKQKSTGKVFCAVFLIRWSNDHFNFSYKDMTEFAGPCEIQCPPKIFKLLTPLDDTTDPNGYGREWRKKVKVLHDTRKHLSKGGVVKLKNAVKFTDGSAYQFFMRKNRKYYIADKDGDGFKEGYLVHFNPLKFDCKMV